MTPHSLAHSRSFGISANTTGTARPTERGVATANDWLQSPQLSKIAAYVSRRYSLANGDLPDLLQELRIALWRHGLQQPINVTWVFHTAAHKAVDFQRRAKLSAGLSARLRYVASRPDPELLHITRARVARLPRRLRAYYLLRYVEGRTQRELAASLSISRASVRWLEHRCRQHLSGR